MQLPVSSTVIGEPIGLLVLTAAVLVEGNRVNSPCVWPCLYGFSTNTTLICVHDFPTAEKCRYSSSNRLQQLQGQRMACKVMAPLSPKVPHTSTAALPCPAVHSQHLQPCLSKPCCLRGFGWWVCWHQQAATWLRQGRSGYCAPAWLSPHSCNLECLPKDVKMATGRLNCSSWHHSVATKCEQNLVHLSIAL